MQIRKADKYVYDIFLGNGFDQWSRVRRFHWGFKVVGGNKLSRDAMEIVSQKLDIHWNGGIQSV